MGLKHFKANLEKQSVSPKEIEKRVRKREIKANTNAIREAIYLGILDARKEEKIIGYKRKKLIKAGESSSVKQRKIAKNKECRTACLRGI